jgi:hypothetical protein
MNFIGINTLDELIKISQEDFYPEFTHGYDKEDVNSEDGYVLEFLDHFKVLYNTLETSIRMSKGSPATREYPEDPEEIEEVFVSILATTYIKKESLIEPLVSYNSIDKLVKELCYNVLEMKTDSDLDDMYQEIVNRLAHQATEYDSYGRPDESTRSYVEDFIPPEDLDVDVVEVKNINVKHSDDSVAPYIFIKMKFHFEYQ